MEAYRIMLYICSILLAVMLYRKQENIFIFGERLWALYWMIITLSFFTALVTVLKIFSIHRRKIHSAIAVSQRATQSLNFFLPTTSVISTSTPTLRWLVTASGLARTGGNQGNGLPRQWYFVNMARNSQCVLGISLFQGTLTVFNCYQGADRREDLIAQVTRLDCYQRGDFLSVIAILQEIIKRAARTPALLYNVKSLAIPGHNIFSVICNRRVNNAIIGLLAILQEIENRASREPAHQHGQESCALPGQDMSSVSFNRRVYIIGPHAMLRETVMKRVGEEGKMRRVPALLHSHKDSAMLGQDILGLSRAHHAIRHCCFVSLSSKSSIELSRDETETHCKRDLDTKSSDSTIALIDKGPINAHDISGRKNDENKLNGAQVERNEENSQEVAPLTDSLVDNGGGLEGTGSGRGNFQGNASTGATGQMKGHVNDEKNCDLNGHVHELADGYIVSESEDENEDYAWMYSSDSENDSMNESDDENSLVDNHDGMKGINTHLGPTGQASKVLRQRPGFKSAALVSGLTENERENIDNRNENGQSTDTGLNNVQGNTSGFVNAQMEGHMIGRENYDRNGNANELADGYFVSDSEDENEDCAWMYGSELEHDFMYDSDDENSLMGDHDEIEEAVTQRCPAVCKVQPGFEGAALVSVLTDSERVDIKNKQGKCQPTESSQVNVQGDLFTDGQMKDGVSDDENYGLNDHVDDLADGNIVFDLGDESEDNAGMSGSKTENDLMRESDHKNSLVGNHDEMEGINAQQCTCPTVSKILPGFDGGIEGSLLAEKVVVNIEEKQENGQTMQSELDDVEGNATDCANGKMQCLVNGDKNCDLNGEVDYHIVYDSENENEDDALMSGSKSRRDSMDDNESNYDWMYGSDSENDSMYESETYMNQGEEGDNLVELVQHDQNANNEDALIVPGNVQQVYQQEAENHPVNPQDHQPGLQDEAPVAHMIHAVPNVAPIPQAYQPNPELQDEAPVGEGAQQLPHIQNYALIPPWFDDNLLQAQALLNVPANPQDQQPNQGPLDEAPAGGNPHHLPIQHAQDPLLAGNENGGAENHMDANDGGDHEEALALALPAVPQQGQIPQQENQPQHEDAPQQGNQPQQGNHPQQGNQPQQANQAQQPPATGPLSKLKAAARYVKRKLTRNHHEVPMYVPGAPREERTPLGLEEAPALIGVPLIPHGEDGGMDEEAQPRGLCACFAFLFRHHVNPVQEYPLQAEQVEEFEEQLAIVEPEVDVIEGMEDVEQPMDAAEQQIEANVLPVEAF